MNDAKSLEVAFSVFICWAKLQNERTTSKQTKKEEERKKTIRKTLIRWKFNRAENDERQNYGVSSFLISFHRNHRLSLLFVCLLSYHFFAQFITTFAFAPNNLQIVRSFFAICRLNLWPKFQCIICHWKIIKRFPGPLLKCDLDFHFHRANKKIMWKSFAGVTEDAVLLSFWFFSFEFGTIESCTVWQMRIQPNRSCSPTNGKSNHTSTRQTTAKQFEMKVNCV